MALDGTNSAGRPAAASTLAVPAPTEATRSAGRPQVAQASRTTEAASGEVMTIHPYMPDVSFAGSSSAPGSDWNSMQGSSTEGTPRALSSACSFTFLPNSRVR